LEGFTRLSEVEYYLLKKINSFGCDWDFDIEKIVCEYLEVEKLKEID